MAHLLVAEDDPNILTLLENFLAAGGHQVDTASDGAQALGRFAQGQYDLVLLDIMMPKIDGYGVLEVIRQTSAVPVIFITALDSEAHQLRGYDLAADDYVTKPFSMQVLLRKVAAVLRRAGPDATADILCLKGIKIDTGSHEVTARGKRVQLTPKEYELLVRLMHARGRVLTRELLLESVWGYDFFGDERVVDTHIKNLRRKLGVDSIKTIRGAGYRIDQTPWQKPDA